MRGAGRVIAIVLAILLAAFATYAIYSYVQGLEQRAFEDAELVEVFIAQEEIPEGISANEAGEAGLIERGSIPQRNVPEQAVTSLDQLEGLVALSPILENEVLSLGRWGDPDEVDAPELDIPEDFEAISVQVGIPPGVAGFIQAGDQVSLIATTEAPGETEVEDDGTVVEEEPEFRSQYLLQDIQVLAAGQRVVTEEGDEDVEESEGQVLLTLALEPEDAERLALAIETSSLYFTLLPDDAEPQETPGRTLDDLFDD
ncbi:MAG: Flp pilus assembly protein CpaB [Nitriliruptoraceae bacterium]